MRIIKKVSEKITLSHVDESDGKELIAILRELKHSNRMTVRAKSDFSPFEIIISNSITDYNVQLEKLYVID
jgi:hypothetical protein